MYMTMMIMTYFSFFFQTILVIKRTKYVTLPVSYLNPSLAITPSPQNEKFLGCVAPMTSEKCVSQSACVGKFLGCVWGDQRPSNTICNQRLLLDHVDKEPLRCEQYLWVESLGSFTINHKARFKEVYWSLPEAG